MNKIETTSNEGKGVKNILRDRKKNNSAIKVQSLVWIQQMFTWLYIHILVPIMNICKQALPDDDKYLQ